MTKTEHSLYVLKEMIRGLARAAEFEGAPHVTRVDLTSTNYGWRSRYNPKHTKNIPGFQVSRAMEEVAIEEGWVFTFDVRANGARDNIRIEFPINMFNSDESRCRILGKRVA